MTPLRTSLAWVMAAAITAAAAVPPSTARPLLVGAPHVTESASVTPAYHTYAWPVEGPVLRSFEPPTTPYSSGHRGIDIEAPFGSPLKATNEGVVAFAGWVGGSLFISIDHPDGVRTTYSWLSAVSVKAGQPVSREQTIGATGHGHPEVAQPHLHFGARIGSTYIDPMLLLEGGSVAGLIHLAPMQP
jgi:murein DD-endopeptidase MepM/ murein hydrolase activator NlpD